MNHIRFSQRSRTSQDAVRYMNIIWSRFLKNNESGSEAEISSKVTMSRLPDENATLSVICGLWLQLVSDKADCFDTVFLYVQTVFGSA